MDERRPRPAFAWPPVLLLLVALCWRAANTPLAIVIAALAPAGLYAVLVTRFDGHGARPTSLWIAAFLWGAVVAASTASTLNAVMLLPRLGAPIVEELAKGAALILVVVVWPRELADARAGIVYGALIGVGFAASENLLYLTMAALQGGYAGLLRSAYLRATVYGMNHAVFTAATGAAVGYARTVTSRAAAVLVTLVGVAAAVALHVAWNTVVSDAIATMLCAAPYPGAACRNPPPAETLYVTVPLVVMGFIGPCVAALLVIGVRSRAR